MRARYHSKPPCSGRTVHKLKGNHHQTVVHATILPDVVARWGKPGPTRTMQTTAGRPFVLRYQGRTTAEAGNKLTSAVGEAKLEKQVVAEAAGAHWSMRNPRPQIVLR